MMNPQCARIVGNRATVATILLAVIGIAPQAHSQSAPDASGDDGAAQVMTRGPVHEAFAAPLVHNPQAGPIVAKQPPQAVEELPPDQKPAGANVLWIPGYWQWDQERNDFLWISGVWREPPPGRQWVPGYWNQVDGGYQWAPGAWVATPEANPAPSQAAAGSDQSLYLPAPPPTLEAGPSSPSPSPQVFWSPGSWNWLGTRYAWRPGFWAAAQPGWVWMPAHFVWTPGGYLFVQGYWDLPIASRGLMFAPVYYPQPIYLQPGYVYSPSVGIMAPGFTANLFVQPGYNQYCFGDYYAQSYLSVGIFPWFSVSISSGPRYYDPLFAYYSGVNMRRDPMWITHVREEYIVRRDNVAMRPAHTLVEQTRLIREGGGRERVQVMARPLGEMGAHAGEAHAMRLERVDASSRRQFQSKAAELHLYREQRVMHERAGARTAAAAGGKFEPRPMHLAHSPVASRPTAAHQEAERHVGADLNRRENVAHAEEHRSAGLRRTEPAATHPAVRTGVEPNMTHTNALQGANPRQPAAQPHLQPRASAVEPHNNLRNPGQGQAERRTPPHPTPYQRERREPGKER